MPQELIGGFERTGIYLSREDFEELKQVIARAQMKDALLKKGGVAQMGGSGKLFDAPTVGSMTIQNFIRELVKNYGFKDSDRVLYGTNNKGEILRWMTPDQVTEHNTKKPGRKTI